MEAMWYLTKLMRRFLLVIVVLLAAASCGGSSDELLAAAGLALDQPWRLEDDAVGARGPRGRLDLHQVDGPRPLVGVIIEAAAAVTPGNALTASLIR